MEGITYVLYREGTKLTLRRFNARIIFSSLLNLTRVLCCLQIYRGSEYPLCDFMMNKICTTSWAFDEIITLCLNADRIFLHRSTIQVARR